MAVKINMKAAKAIATTLNSKTNCSEFIALRIIAAMVDTPRTPQMMRINIEYFLTELKLNSLYS